jgi:hypothetical protein
VGLGGGGGRFTPGNQHGELELLHEVDSLTVTVHSQVESPQSVIRQGVCTCREAGKKSEGGQGGNKNRKASSHTEFRYPAGRGMGGRDEDGREE